MSATRPIETSTTIAVSQTLPLGDPMNATVEMQGAGGVVAYIVSVDTGAPTFTVEALLNRGTTWEQIQCYQEDVATHTKTLRAAGTAITPTARDKIHIPAMGYVKVRLKKASAATAFTVCLNTCATVYDNLIDQVGTTLTAVVPGTGATNLGKAEDGAHTSGDTGVMALGVRQNTNASLAGADADYMPFILDALGRLWTAPPAYAVVSCGELAGSATAVQMPTVAGPLIVKFKAAYDNAGRVYIGGSGVTVKNGTTDTTTGFELSAGEETPWLPVTNVNVFYRICDNAGDDLTYVALSG